MQSDRFESNRLTSPALVAEVPGRGTPLVLHQPAAAGEFEEAVKIDE